MKRKACAVRILTVLAAAAFAVILSACGGSSSGQEGASSKKETAEKKEAAGKNETAEAAGKGAKEAADEFHLTIEEAQQNAMKIAGRLFLDPEGNFHCENSTFSTCKKILDTYGTDIKMIGEAGTQLYFIDQDDLAHRQVDFSLYDEPVIWACNNQLAGLVSKDHRLLFDKGSSLEKLPEFDDAVMADEDDREVAVLHTDGTVTLHSIATDGTPSQWDWNIDVSSLTDIVQMGIVAMGRNGKDPVPMVVGLKSDGTMVSSAGYPEELSGWTDIVAFNISYNGIIALKSDGTLVCCGEYIQRDYDRDRMGEMQHVRWFSVGKNALSAVSDDGYSCGEVQFASTVLHRDGTYDDYAPIPEYEDWLEE